MSLPPYNFITLLPYVFAMQAAVPQGSGVSVDEASERLTDCVLLHRNLLRDSSESPNDIAIAVLSMCRNEETALSDAYSRELSFVSESDRRREIVARESRKSREALTEALIGYIVHYRLQHRR